MPLVANQCLRKGEDSSPQGRGNLTASWKDQKRSKSGFEQKLRKNSLADNEGSLSGTEDQRQSEGGGRKKKEKKKKFSMGKGKRMGTHS